MKDPARTSSPCSSPAACSEVAAEAVSDALAPTKYMDQFQVEKAPCRSMACGLGRAEWGGSEGVV
jgi:hypothetical protein